MKIIRTMPTRISRNLALLVLIVIALAESASAQTQQFPITAWTDLLAPTASSIWMDPASGNQVRFDTFGKLNGTLSLGLGTTVSGSVTLMEIGDGMQQVVIHVNTTNGICWGLNANNEPAFGYRPAEILSGLGPAAVGRTTWRITQFPQPVGPIRFWPIQSIIGNLTCDGVLRAGSGYPEGTPGFAQTTQTGLGMTGVPGGCPREHDADCFPAEKVQFKATGN
jgi:hypothetical protein